MYFARVAVRFEGIAARYLVLHSTPSQIWKLYLEMPLGSGIPFSVVYQPISALLISVRGYVTYFQVFFQCTLHALVHFTGFHCSNCSVLVAGKSCSQGKILPHSYVTLIGLMSMFVQDIKSSKPQLSF